MSHEIELKLALPQRALPALRRHPLIAGAPKLGNAVTLDNTYYDTPDLALKARKVALRIRRQGRLSLQTVKCAAVSSGGLSQRPEWEQAYAEQFDFSAIDAPEVAKLLNRHRDALVPVFTTRFRRETRRHAPRPGLSILLMIDTGEVIVTTAAGELQRTPICELELELEAGRPQDLVELASTLAQDLPLMPADISKAERGYRLFLGTPLSATRAEASAITPGQNVVDAFRTLALSCVRQWQANAAAALAHADPDSIHPDFIHQLRVSQRRLRALLKFFAPALPPGFVGEWNQRLRENAARFGDARDLDVFCTELLDAVTPEGLADVAAFEALLQTAHEMRDAARSHATHNLDMATQGRLLLGFTAALLQLPTGSLAEAADLRTFARLRLDRLRKRARRQFEAAATLVPTRLHALRIGFKQLRYGIEFFAPLFPAKAVDRYLEGMVRAQTLLGFLQDVDTAQARLAQWVQDRPALAPAAAFVLGWHASRYARLRRRVLHDCEPLLWGKKPW
ncbi:MAG TPA: CHAD domain-containing protein [Thauera sp.]|uniref:CYTH and CHAD domain-containing protein n=1 Tax=Thauera sp. TaxID=1905334 RepID=UPI002B549BB5|nr:CHAD domain-containing protein [Thauera sp.]HRP23692.1 CHAD domain-containing protein [Thauera sp.]HRP64878.1 CHAD domain-containing protein [Thauera sp.]